MNDGRKLVNQKTQSNVQKIVDSIPNPIAIPIPVPIESS